MMPPSRSAALPAMSSSIAAILTGLCLLAVAVSAQYGGGYEMAAGGYDGASAGYGEGAEVDDRPKVQLGVRLRVPAIKFELPRFSMPKITISAKIRQPDRPRTINLPAIDLDTTSKVAPPGSQPMGGYGGGGSYASAASHQPYSSNGYGGGESEKTSTISLSSESDNSDGYSGQQSYGKQGGASGYNQASGYHQQQQQQQHYYQRQPQQQQQQQQHYYRQQYQAPRMQQYRQRPMQYPMMQQYRQHQYQGQPQGSAYSSSSEIQPSYALVSHPESPSDSSSLSRPTGEQEPNKDTEIGFNESAYSEPTEAYNQNNKAIGAETVQNTPPGYYDVQRMPSASQQQHSYRVAHQAEQSTGFPAIHLNSIARLPMGGGARLRLM